MTKANNKVETFKTPLGYVYTADNRQFFMKTQRGWVNINDLITIDYELFEEYTQDLEQDTLIDEFNTEKS